MNITELHCNLVVLLLHAAVSEKGKVCKARLGRDQVEGAFLPAWLKKVVERALKKLLVINYHGNQNVSFTEQTFTTYAQIYVEYKIVFLQMPIIS